MSIAGELPLKEAYQDLIHPSAKEMGEIVSLVPRTLHVLFHPYERWLNTKEINFQETATLIAQRMKGVDPDNLVEPEPYVAIPALQSLSYCMNSQELREMYANLLAKAIQKDKKDTVHPAFLEIIRQMSPTDARILDLYSQKAPLPLCQIKATHNIKDLQPIENFKHFKRCFKSSVLILDNVDDLPELHLSIEETAVSIANLRRLGLLDCLFKTFYSDKSCYAYLDDSPRIAKYCNSIRHILPESTPYLYLEFGIAQLSPFSRSFVDTCIRE